jgi:hypothetical protein
LPPWAQPVCPFRTKHIFLHPSVLEFQTLEPQDKLMLLSDKGPGGGQGKMAGKGIWKKGILWAKLE